MSPELLALRVIVMHLVAVRANEYEKSGSGPGQSWINHIAANCSEDILAADISGLTADETQKMRQDAVQHVNKILGGIRGLRKSARTS
ncbi:MAG: hypothetical protein ACLPKB_03530 [Xanthobacteraceae bacterium]